MNGKRWALFGIAILLSITGCSPGYKTGAAITPADLAKALPEFPIALPPGGTNLYLEHDARRPLVSSWLKVTVPSASLTNFLHSFGFADEFIVATPQMIGMQTRIPLPAGLDMRSAASWLGSMPREAHHAAEWDLKKVNGPVRLYLVSRPGISSANDRVMLLGYVDASSADYSKVYLEYRCLHR